MRILPVTVLIVCGVVTVLTAGQAPLTFEVASVKPSAPNTQLSTWGYGPGATVRFQNIGLRPIIADAYDLDFNAATSGGEYRLVGGPRGLLDRPFDIDARAPAGATQAQKKEMLRTLLADRFKLRIRKETRQMPIYVLTMAGKDFGKGLKRSSLDCDSQAAKEYRSKNRDVPTPCNVLRTEATRSSYAFRGAGPMSKLLSRIQEKLDRPLVDQTGLSGNFEWATKYRLSPIEGDAPVFVDAVRQDLGLRVTPTNGPFEVFVIDSVQMPTPN